MSITDVEKKLVVTNEERKGQDRGGGLRGMHKILLQLTSFHGIFFQIFQVTDAYYRIIHG